LNRSNIRIFGLCEKCPMQFSAYCSYYCRTNSLNWVVTGEIVELNNVSKMLDRVFERSLTKGIAMGLSVSKAKSISGIALISAIVAGCGGGGGGTAAPGGVPTPAGAVYSVGSVTCDATNNGQALADSNGALLGACEQYEASAIPTKASTAFRSPGTNLPLSYSSTAGYTLTLPVLANGGTVVLPLDSLVTLPGGTVPDSFGNYAGLTYRKILDAANGGTAYAYDYTNTKTLIGGKYLDLLHSRYGMFSRFGTRALGYYGGWAQGNSVGTLPTGTVSYRGAVIGVLGPNVGTVGTSAGFSAEIVMTVNFANTTNPITTLELKNFGYTANGSRAITVEVATGGAVQSSTLDAGTQALAASFTASSAGANPIPEGKLSGSFYGDSTKPSSEFVGTLKFRTADGRNAVGAFGLRSGASIVNP
jgi:hypothetical protein